MQGSPAQHGERPWQRHHTHAYHSCDDVCSGGERAPCQARVGGWGMGVACDRAQLKSIAVALDAQRQRWQRLCCTRSGGSTLEATASTAHSCQSHLFLCFRATSPSNSKINADLPVLRGAAPPAGSNRCGAPSAAAASVLGNTLPVTQHQSITAEAGSPLSDACGVGLHLGL